MKLFPYLRPVRKKKKKKTAQKNQIFKLKT